MRASGITLCDMYTSSLFVDQVTLCARFIGGGDTEYRYEEEEEEGFMGVKNFDVLIIAT